MSMCGKDLKCLYMYFPLLRSRIGRDLTDVESYQNMRICTYFYYFFVHFMGMFV